MPTHTNFGSSINFIGQILHISLGMSGDSTVASFQARAPSHTWRYSHARARAQLRYMLCHALGKSLLSFRPVGVGPNGTAAALQYIEL